MLILRVGELLLILIGNLLNILLVFLDDLLDLPVLISLDCLHKDVRLELIRFFDRLFLGAMLLLQLLELKLVRFDEILLLGLELLLPLLSFITQLPCLSFMRLLLGKGFTFKFVDALYEFLLLARLLFVVHLLILCYLTLEIINHAA